jgi:transcriptional regulator with XRE-family HTH domain
MPKKPKFIHPVRQVRTCLGRTQEAFARMLGCSTITIQRIENGSLELSSKLANTIMEATGVDPASLRSGPTGKALDFSGKEYNKDSFDFYHKALPCDVKEFKYLVLSLSHYLQLMLLTSNRANQLKMRAVFHEIQNSFVKIAEDFHLKDGIHNYLIENGYVDKRKYRVSDLRKFPEFARIIGYKDDKRFSPDKIIPYVRPKGWIPNYILIESAILPPEADMKLPSNASYIIDNERPLPEELKNIFDQALYWKIKEFRLSFVDPPQKAE